MKKLIILLLALYTLPAISSAQVLNLAEDSSQAFVMNKALKSTFLELHQQFMAGKITAYFSDSFNRIMTVPHFKNKFVEKNVSKNGEITIEQIDVDQVYRGWSVMIEEQTSPIDVKIKREVLALAPLYVLQIDGHDIGNFPIYYLNLKDVAKALSEEDYMRLMGSLRISEMLFSNYDNQKMILTYNRNGDLTKEIVTPKKNDHIISRLEGRKLYESHIDQAQEITKSLQSFVFQELYDALHSKEDAYDCYTDADLKNAIADLPNNDAFKKVVVI